METLFAEFDLLVRSLTSFFAFDTAKLDDTQMQLRIAFQVLLLMGSAFFSGSETALFSLSRLDLQSLRRERNPRSEFLHELLDQPRRLIISILCGNELVNIAAAVNMAGILVVLYGPARAGTISVLVMVPLLLLFGEVTPKTIAVSNPVRFSTRLVAVPMSLWVRFVTPLVWLIRGVSDRITTLIVGEAKAAENILQVDEFRTLVETSAAEGGINATERALIHNLLEAGDTEIVEIMTPRTRTCFIDGTQDVATMVEQFRGFRHPRVPVYVGSRDNLIGFMHAEDILRMVMDRKDPAEVPRESLLCPPVVVPLTKKVDEMFDFFQANRARAAAVLNEFGGVEGFVTMKDVLTFIFGQISGDISGHEHYLERDENRYEVLGEMKLTDFNNLTHFGLEDPRMTTIGGVAFRYLDRLPRVGDQVTVEGVVITVLDVEAHRIARVRVEQGFTQDTDDETDEPPPEDETPDSASADADSGRGGKTEDSSNAARRAVPDVPIAPAALARIVAQTGIAPN